jgi:hypothetical protein
LLAYNRTLLRLLLYSYNNFSLAILTFFHCQPLDSVHGSRLYSFPSVSCTSAGYRALLPAFIGALVVIVLGGPLALLLLLCRQRRAAAEAARLRPVLDEAEAAKQALAARIAYARYGLLYASYRDDCWYWSCVVLLQRAVVISLFVFVPSPAAFTWLTAVNLSILTTQLIVQPNRSGRDNRLETVLLFVLCLQTMIAAQYPPSPVTNAVAAMVSSIILIPALALRAVLWAASKPTVRWAAARTLSWLQQRSQALSSWCPQSAAGGMHRSGAANSVLFLSKEDVNDEL